MPCCLMTPSQHLNHVDYLSVRSYDTHLRAISQEIIKIKLQLHLPGANVLNYDNKTLQIKSGGLEC